MAKSKRPLPPTDGLILLECHDAKEDGGAIEIYNTARGAPLIRVYHYNVTGSRHAQNDQKLVVPAGIMDTYHAMEESNTKELCPPFEREHLRGGKHDKFFAWPFSIKLWQRFGGGRRVEKGFMMANRPRVHDFEFTKDENGAPIIISKPYCYFTIEEIVENTTKFSLADKPTFYPEKAPFDNSPYCFLFFYRVAALE